MIDLVTRRGHDAQILVAARLFLLSLCAIRATVVPEPRPVALLACLSLAALIGSVPARSRRRLALLISETAISAVGVAFVADDPETALPYLLAPALAIGLHCGPLASTLAMSGAALGLAAHAFVRVQEGMASYFAAVATWLLLSTAAGLLAGWVQRLRQQPSLPVDPSYAAAYRLLSQLHAVSRRLPDGLDAVALSHSLLARLRDHIPFDRGAILVRSPGGRLMPLVVEGDGHIDWHVDPDEDSALAEAWATAEPLQRPRPLSSGGGEGHSVVLPLHFGLRNFGLVALELAAAVPWVGVKRAYAEATESALPIATALLFEDVRSIATAEERRRLAREIHDGIAQELASLGYLIDDLTSEAAELPVLETALTHLRDEITRLVTELRFSIFDLRSEVASAGLGMTLADYVRDIGASSLLTVHLILDETPARLRLEIEGELLRIAQEAVTNVRRHASAENLWVTCRVAPPHALVRVEDDGRGLGEGRSDSFGMEIMRERATRIGARLRVEPRAEGGTVVEVVLGPEPGAPTSHETRLEERL